VNVYKFIMDKKKNDGSIFRDCAFSNVYVCEFNGKIEDFNFDKNEVIGLVKINAKETLNLLEKETGQINGIVIKNANNENYFEEKIISIQDFLVNKGENAIKKYGDVLTKIIEITN